MIVLAGIAIGIHRSDLSIIFITVAVGFLVTAGEGFYFELTDDGLITRNYMIPFLAFHYKLSKITEVQFLETSSKSIAKARVKIIHGDKRSFPVSASSLSINDWQSFIDDLTAKKIQVDIQAISLKSAIGISED